jgi:hypothetical protein
METGPVGPVLSRDRPSDRSCVAAAVETGSVDLVLAWTAGETGRVRPMPLHDRHADSVYDRAAIETGSVRPL